MKHYISILMVAITLGLAFPAHADPQTTLRQFRVKMRESIMWYVNHTAKQLSIAEQGAENSGANIENMKLLIALSEGKSARISAEDALKRLLDKEGKLSSVRTSDPDTGTSAFKEATSYYSEAQKKYKAVAQSYRSANSAAQNALRYLDQNDDERMGAYAINAENISKEADSEHNTAYSRYNDGHRLSEVGREKYNSIAK